MGMQHACLLLEYIGGRMRWRAAPGARESRELRQYIAVKLLSKKVEWKLSSKKDILCFVYIEASINKCEKSFCL